MAGALRPPLVVFVIGFVPLNTIHSLTSGKKNYFSKTKGKKNPHPETLRDYRSKPTIMQLVNHIRVTRRRGANQRGTHGVRTAYEHTQTQTHARTRKLTHIALLIVGGRTHCRCHGLRRSRPSPVIAEGATLVAALVAALVEDEAAGRVHVRWRVAGGQSPPSLSEP
jgi:hypothetical protein